MLGMSKETITCNRQPTELPVTVSQNGLGQELVLVDEKLLC